MTSGAQDLDGWAVHWHHNGSKVGNAGQVPFPSRHFPVLFCYPISHFTFPFTSFPYPNPARESGECCTPPPQGSMAQRLHKKHFWYVLRPGSILHIYRLTLSSKCTTAKYWFPLPNTNTHQISGSVLDRIVMGSCPCVLPPLTL